ncbi:MAG: hypothetical protein ABJF01_17700 [bacterium]
MIRQLALGALLLMGGAFRANAQVKVELRNPGPGIGGSILTKGLAGAHIVIPPGPVTHAVAKDTTLNTTVISLGRDVVVSGTVRGDVIVVGADLYMNPGGTIDGRGIAIGGGVYESALAHIAAGATAYRDFTYEIDTIPGGFALSYRPAAGEPEEPPLSLPGIYGLRAPTYDRTNGLSLAVGPEIIAPGVGTRIEPRITYRSQLGVVDPSLRVTQPIDRLTALHAFVGRSTFSNETWIWSDLMNSVATLLTGDDARNYFRATRAEASLSHKWEGAMSSIEPYVGGRWERARSVRPDSFARGGPWSFLNRHDRDDMLRPNPAFTTNTLASVLGGAQFDWADRGMVALARVDAEAGWARPTCSGCDTVSRASFTQATFDGSITFPTFGLQSLSLDAHIVASGGSVPLQRYAYVGGPGTIGTLELLERGGDQVMFFDGRYAIPLAGILLPLGISPVVTLREVLAGAAVGSAPRLAQASGVRLTLGLGYFEFLVDPDRRRGVLGVGFSAAR